MKNKTYVAVGVDFNNYSKQYRINCGMNTILTFDGRKSPQQAMDFFCSRYKINNEVKFFTFKKQSSLSVENNYFYDLNGVLQKEKCV